MTGQPVGLHPEREMVEQTERELDAIEVRGTDADTDAEHPVIEVARGASDRSGEIAPQSLATRLGGARLGSLRNLKSSQHRRVTRVARGRRRARTRHRLTCEGDDKGCDERSERQPPPKCRKP